VKILMFFILKIKKNFFQKSWKF